eukprot:3031469-Pleurochrysis_carterae.AAC.1
MMKESAPARQRKQEIAEKRMYAALHQKWERKRERESWKGMYAAPSGRPGAIMQSSRQSPPHLSALGPGSSG